MHIIGNFWVETCILYFLPYLFKKTFPRHWVKEKVVRKISSLGRISDMPSLLGVGVFCGYGERVCISLPEVPGDRGGLIGNLELATRKDRLSERSQISQKDFGWKTLGP